jgi:hypothetical protein
MTHKLIIAHNYIIAISICHTKVITMSLYMGLVLVLRYMCLADDQKQV